MSYECMGWDGPLTSKLNSLPSFRLCYERDGPLTYLGALGLPLNSTILSREFGWALDLSLGP
jgi:hypothetical protein